MTGTGAPASGRGAKALWYLLFAFVGIFAAEAISGNAPFAPLFPPFYAIYGLLDVLLLDFLIRRRVRSWIPVYVAGVIVGYLTESFAAKVMWVGWPGSHLNAMGVLPIPELPFLAFFYHPIFSFCVPVTLARRFLGCPLPLRRSRVADALMWAWPFFPALMLPASRYGPSALIGFVAADLLVFLGILAWLARFRPVPDLRLSPRSRWALGLLLAASYAVALFRMPPFHRSEMYRPSMLQIGVSAAFLLCLVGLLRRAVPRSVTPAAAPFDPGAIRYSRVALGALYIVAALGAGIVVVRAVPAIGGALRAAIGFVGVVGGTGLFLYAVFVCVRGR